MKEIQQKKLHAAIPLVVVSLIEVRLDELMLEQNLDSREGNTTEQAACSNTPCRGKINRC